tara:strand:+ start:242 stop:730 length:489 start_codon:yes stop_codon:yes gene_type:complete
MKSVNIKGKEYITVNERLIYFRSKPTYKGWKIIEELVSLDDKEGVFKVTIFNSENHQVVNAHAQEYRDSSYINKTSFVENGFTSALGRALGYLGIGIDTAIASADEVQTAVKNQPKDNKSWLNENQLIATLKGTKEQAEKVIGNYKMKKEYREKINNQFNLK